MPPIKSEIKIAGNTVPLNDVVPGEIATFTDYSPLGHSLIAIQCNPEDDGAIIYRITDPNTVELNALQVRLIEPGKGEIEAVVEVGGSADLTFNTRKYGRAVMKLQHY